MFTTFTSTVALETESPHWSKLRPECVASNCIGVIRFIRSAFIALAIISALTGCISVPYRTSAESHPESNSFKGAGSLRLIASPTKFADETEFLDYFVRVARKDFDRMEVVDRLSFVAVASPTGVLTLDMLNEPTTRKNIEPFGVDYLVLLKPPLERLVDEHGLLDRQFPLAFGKVGVSTSQWAAVIDAKTMQLLSNWTTVSEGNMHILGLGVSLGAEADTAGSVRSEVIQQIMKAIEASRPAGRVRVLFLAVIEAPTIDSSD